MTLGQRPERRSEGREQIDTGSGFRQRRAQGHAFEEEQALGSWSRKDGGLGAGRSEGIDRGGGRCRGPGTLGRGLCLHESEPGVWAEQGGPP